MLLFRAQLLSTTKGPPLASISGAPLLDLDDATRYPQLFDPPHRFETIHLNEAGAQVFTKLLAGYLGAHLTTDDHAVR